ncbi:MAG TPA: hypothetical protein VK348_11480, partial [Planctomycetota bacterium]|nr:hypothetical protein [Planctomycetota bacterium]
MRARVLFHRSAGNALAAGTAILIATAAARTQEFVNFEGPQTHSVAVARAGDHLFATNTPGNRLSVFSLADARAPRLEAEIPVGLEPVAVAERNGDEVWVVDWLSDAVSIVSLRLGCVVATLPAGDEPADIVFAGTPARAFVSSSGNRELRVFDPQSRAELARLPIFGDAPRALAATADGRLVFVAALRSGNGTTIVPAALAPRPPPPMPGLPTAPQQGILVRSDDPQWAKTLGVVLPDHDVFAIDTAALHIVDRFAGVGTLLFAIGVDPIDGDLWVANTEARNLVRFEPALRGHAIDHRLTRIVRSQPPRIEPYDLNPGIDYTVLPDPAARSRALAQPTAVCFAPDGERCYLAAFASDRIGVLDRHGAIQGRIEVTPLAERGDPRHMRGPRALAHHPRAPLLYVLNRIAHSLSVVDTEAGAVIAETSLGTDPTPAAIARGRGFLYSADLSGNGTMSCASCHVDGDWDGLAWDLGDPGGTMGPFPNRDIIDLKMHPMKGPMTTQTLRGLLPELAPFHRRGDRPRLQDFNVSFDKLLGGRELTAADMDAYTAFLQTLAFPPNPNQALDRTCPFASPPGTANGPELFRAPFQGRASCETCHAGPAGSKGLIVSGNLLEYQPQAMKVPQLRDVYKRTARVPHDGLRMSGFGVFHDGSIDSVFDFLGLPFFRRVSHEPATRRELERFVMAFDT